jgi:hypothetical protein
MDRTGDFLTEHTYKTKNKLKWNLKHMNELQSQGGM